jgi:hypothetical protein
MVAELWATCEDRIQGESLPVSRICGRQADVDHGISAPRPPATSIPLKNPNLMCC